MTQSCSSSISTVGTSAFCSRWHAFAVKGATTHMPTAWGKVFGGNLSRDRRKAARECVVSHTPREMWPALTSTTPTSQGAWYPLLQCWTTLVCVKEELEVSSILVACATSNMRGFEDSLLVTSSRRTTCHGPPACGLQLVWC